MGFLDKLRGKKDKVAEEAKEQTSQSTHSSNQAPPGKRIKKYTSEGKPVYE